MLLLNFPVGITKETGTIEDAGGMPTNSLPPPSLQFVNTVSVPREPCGDWIRMGVTSPCEVFQPPYPARTACYHSLGRASSRRTGRAAMSQISIAPASPVVVVGFDMPFWPLVRFLIKIAIASIPAGIVIALFYMVLGWIYGAILVATHHTSLLK